MVPPSGAPPTLRVERACWGAGDRVVVGVDEVGRGAWAGPVSVGAIVVPSGRRLYKVRDSKLLTRQQRVRLHERIVDWAPAVAVGHAWPDECDEHGMTAALRLAGRRALATLEARGFPPDRVLLDGRHDYLGFGQRVRTIVGGDASSLGVAAASIVAKVTRDHLMAEGAEQYPGYDFERNVGYPSPVHQLALAGYGPTAIHRRSWMFMDALPWFRCRPEVEQRSLFGAAQVAARGTVGVAAGDTAEATAGIPSNTAGPDPEG